MKRSRQILLVAATVPGIPVASIIAFWLYSSSDVITYDSVGGGALVSADGRTISATGAGGCDQIVSLVAAETQATVTVRLRYAQPRRPPCSGFPGVAVYRARLAEPLGRRRLIDGVTGKAVPYLDVRAIRRPTYVPPGKTHAKLYI